MSVTGNLTAILAELTRNAALVDEQQAQRLADEVQQARHIFTAGAGRSGVAMTGLTNRLMHLGLSVSRIGDITSPHTHPGDLLLLGSGSGATASLVTLATAAKQKGLRIALVTMDADSPIARMADAVVVLPGASPKLQGPAAVDSIQPMGSAFEQLSLLFHDALVMELMQRTGQTSDEMFDRHADLE